MYDQKWGTNSGHPRHTQHYGRFQNSGKRKEPQLTLPYSAIQNGNQGNKNDGQLWIITILEGFSKEM